MSGQVRVVTIFWDRTGHDGLTQSCLLISRMTHTRRNKAVAFGSSVGSAAVAFPEGI